MWLSCTTDLRGLVAQQRLFISGIQKRMWRQWWSTEVPRMRLQWRSFVWREQISAISSTPEQWVTNFCMLILLPPAVLLCLPWDPSTFPLGSRLKAVGWMLTLVSVLGTALKAPVLVSTWVSGKVWAVTLFSVPCSFALCSRTGKVAKGDFAGRCESWQC